MSCDQLLSISARLTGLSQMVLWRIFQSVADNPLWFSALDTIFISYVVDLLMNDADYSYDSYNSGTAQQVFEWREGGGGLFLAPLFLSNYFLFNLFLLLQKSRGGAKAPPSGRFLQLAFD